MDFIDRLASFNWVGIISAAVPAISLIVTLTRTPASRRRLNALLDVQERLPRSCKTT